jgi:hypothetical protein
MEKEVFPLASVGKVYDSLFVSYRLDAEHGEGPKLAAAYAVKAYPTYLFLDSAGNLLYRSGDYMKASNFIAEARKAAAKKSVGETLAGLEARFKSGDRQPALLKALLDKRTSLGMDNTEILNVYVAVMPSKNLRSPETVIYLSQHLGSTVSAALPLVIEGLKGLGPEQQKTGKRPPVQWNALLCAEQGHQRKPVERCGQTAGRRRQDTPLAACAAPALCG